MLKSQLIIIIAAIIAVIFLFNLPKYIVKDERQAKNESEKGMASNEKAVDEAHDLAIDEKDSEKLKNFTKNYLSVSDEEKKVKFADSLAVIYRRIHKYDSSAKYLGEIASLKPEKRNYINAGDAFFDASTFALDQEKSAKLGEKAQEYYKKVLSSEPANLEVKTKLAKTYISTEPMTGVRMLKEVVKEDPDNEEALYNLGILSIQSKQFNKAVERFEVILKNNPDHLEAQFRIGYSYMMLGEKQKARDAFEKVKKLSQDPQVQSTVDTYIKELNN
jgi:outer membrane protein